MTLRRVVPLALVLVAAGCGGGEKATEPTETLPTVGQKTEVRVYWLRDGKVWPVRREVDTTGGVINGTVAQLLVGPSQRERTDLDAKSAIPGSVTRAEIDTSAGVATVKISGSVPRPALAQLVYTLTQFPNVDSVEIGGRSYSRAGFEDLTPLILVESPLPFDEVTSPLEARGTANTFEATFDYELTDPDGKVIAHNFVTATSGNGMRGTFTFTVPFTAPRPGPGELVVYEVSAENGKRVHLVEIPLQLRKS
jgi:germination protein M